MVQLLGDVAQGPLGKNLAEVLHPGALTVQVSEQSLQIVVEVTNSCCHDLLRGLQCINNSWHQLRLLRVYLLSTLGQIVCDV